MDGPWNLSSWDQGLRPPHDDSVEPRGRCPGAAEPIGAYSTAGQSGIPRDGGTRVAPDAHDAFGPYGPYTGGLSVPDVGHVAGHVVIAGLTSLEAEHEEHDREDRQRKHGIRAGDVSQGLSPQFHKASPVLRPARWETSREPSWWRRTAGLPEILSRSLCRAARVKTSGQNRCMAPATARTGTESGHRLTRTPQGDRHGISSSVGVCAGRANLFHTRSLD